MMCCLKCSNKDMIILTDSLKREHWFCTWCGFAAYGPQLFFEFLRITRRKR